MAIVGTAYVQIKAVTTGLEKDVSSAINKSLKNIKVDLGKQIKFDPPDTSDFKRSLTDIERASETTSKRAGNSFIKNFGNGQISYYIRRIFYQILWGTPIIGALIGALAQLGGAFLSLASSIAPAISALAVVPGLLAAAGTAAIGLVAAFSGISKAYSAGTKQMAGGGGAATKAATNNARAIRDAQQAVARAVEDAVDRQADAERDLADAYEEAESSIVRAQRSVRDAENDLAEALYETQRAQLAVNVAREEAANQLIELGFAARQAAISEGTAAISLERAREKLAEVSELPVNHRLRREAQLAYDQAQLNLEEAIKGNTDASKASTNAQAKGIEGSDEVVTAKNDEIDANNDLMKAQEDLADAQNDLTKQQIQNARDIGDAQKNLADTIRDNNRAIQDAQERLGDALTNAGAAAGGAAGGVDAFAEAMKNLSPEAQAFVMYLLSIRDVFKMVRDEAGKDLFPKLTESLETLIGGGFFTQLASGLRIAGSAVGDVAKQFSDLLVNPFFSGNLATIFASNETVIQNIGSALVSLVDAFVSITAAAAPFTEELSKWINSKAGEWAQGFRDDFGGLQQNIADGVAVFKTIAAIFVDIKDAISNLMDAAKPAGDILISAFGDAAEHFKTFTDQNPERLRAFFDQAGESAQEFGGLVRDVVNLMFRLGEGEAGQNIEDIIKILREEAIPAIDDLFKKLNESNTGENIAHLFADLIDTLGLLLDSGALDTFINIIEGAISVLQELAKLPGFGPLVASIGAFLGAYKALNLIVEVSHVRKLGGIFTGAIDGIGKATTAVKGFQDAMAVQSALAPVGTSLSKWSSAVAVLETKIPGLRKFNDGVKSVGDSVTKMSSKLGSGIATGASKFSSALKIAGGAMKTFVIEGAKLLVSLTKQAAAFVASTAKIVANRAAMLLSAAASGIVRAATAAWTAVQWLLNAAMSANPIGLIVLAIAALVAAFLWLWNNVEPFRTFFQDLWANIQVVWENVVEFFKTVWAGVVAVVTWYINLYVTIVTNVFNAVRDFIVGVWEWIQNAAKVVWNAIVDAVRTYIEFYRTIIMAVFNFVKDFIGGTWEWIKTTASTVWSAIVQFVTDRINTLKTNVINIFNNIKDFIGNVWNGIRDTVGNVWNGIISTVSDKVNTLRNMVFGVIQNIKDGIGSILSGLGSVVSGAFSGITGAIRGPINAAIGAVNGIISSINGINFKVPDWVPGLGGKSYGVNLPRIPYLAAGGTVKATNGGTLAMLAEAKHDERVEPLDSDGLSAGDRAIIDALANQQTGNVINITVVAQPNMDVQTLARLVSREIAFLGV